MKVVKNKIKQEELDAIVAKQSELGAIINQIGGFEARKHELLHDFALLNGELEGLKADLEKAYGSVNVDLKTGEYTPIETKDESGS
jgi:hypothetical protein